MNLVQIGANRGNDHVTVLIKNHEKPFDKIILVEPITYVLERLSNCYKDIDNVIIENCIVSNSAKETETIYFHHGYDYETSTLNSKHLLDHGCPEDRIVSNEVKNMTLTALLSKHQIHYLNYLFIDAEGQDIDILMSLDLALTPVDHIHFEIAHSDGVFKRGPKFEAVCEYLKNKGYDLTISDTDLAATRRNKHASM